MSGGGTRSGRRPKSGSSTAAQKATTPAGVSYDQFIKMPLDNRYDLMERIVLDENIKVPDYLDKSITSKIMYALGMNGKPEVISDAEFDKTASFEKQVLYRTVNDNADRKLSARDIIKQINTFDYTQLSDLGGSAYGRAICFADDYGSSAEYITSNSESIMMRVKISPSAKIFDYDKVKFNVLSKEVKRMKKVFPKGYSLDDWSDPAHNDAVPIYAIAHGYAGWYKNMGIDKYFMMLDRRKLVTSPVAKIVKRKDVSLDDFIASAPMSWDDNLDTIQI